MLKTQLARTSKQIPADSPAVAEAFNRLVQERLDALSGEGYLLEIAAGWEVAPPVGDKPKRLFTLFRGKAPQPVSAGPFVELVYPEQFGLTPVFDVAAEPQERARQAVAHAEISGLLNQVFKIQKPAVLIEPEPELVFESEASPFPLGVPWAQEK